MGRTRSIGGLAIAIALVVGAAADQALADAGPSPKREVPDYDGRGPPPAKPGDAALWVPRVVLSPAYFTSEYLLRRPIGAGMAAAERADLPQKIYDFFTFGPNHNIGFAPVGFVEFGFNPSIGVYAFWDDAGFKGDDLRLHAEAWPADWLGASLTERIRFGDWRTVQFRVSGLRRPDYVYYGLGPGTLQSNQSRYAEDLVDAGAAADWWLWRGIRVQTAVGLRTATFGEGHFGGDASLGQEAATGAFPIPYGFERGYTAEYNRVVGILDTRRVWRAPGSGVRLEAHAEQGNDVRQAPASGWIRYGTALGASWDVNGHGRVVSLSVAAFFADPLGSRPIPFTELVALGGSAPMRGFFAGRLIDRSAAVATARYVWPIWPWLGGTIEVATGNVFGEHLQGYRPGLLRLAGSVGISGVGLSEYPLEAIVGWGTETFDHGLQLDAWRVSLSANHSF